MTPPRAPGRGPARGRGYRPRRSTAANGEQRNHRAEGPAAAGFASRQTAADLVVAVMEKHRPFDDALAGAGAPLEPRDRAFARLIAATVLRRHGELAAVLKTFITRPLPRQSVRLWPILMTASAQLLMLQTPPHAAIGTAVDLCRADSHARHFAGLANAVLRRVATEGPAILAQLDGPTLNIPGWMLKRWSAHYGEELARAIAEASLKEAPLDISAKSAPEEWAAKLSGRLLPTGSIRLHGGGRIEDLPGYGDGEWWVQDAAAALPARLLGDVAGLEVADLCAAPGGKTAELAASGAHVTAVELSPDRARRIGENLARLSLAAEIVVADAAMWQPKKQFDAVLLDAPCTATGTIRRHPDILHLKRESDIAQLSDLQARLIANAAKLVRPGGRLVYCTCSLEPEEGEARITDFLASPQFSREPLRAGESGIAPELISRNGDLRTLPVHMKLPDPALRGLDGFFACRLQRQD